MRAALGMLLLCIAVLLVPYGVSRAFSGSTALSVERIPVDDAIAPPRHPEGSELRVVCYNIAHGRGLARSNTDGGSAQERLERLDDIAELLREMDADVVVLNETDFDTSWSQSVDQAAYLARRAGYPYCARLRNLDFCVGFWSWRFGNAVLSRYPITDAREIDLPSYDRWETVLAGKKRALFCEIGVGERAMGIVAVHLSHRSEDLRAASAQALLDFASGYSHPLIFAGDFNSAPTGFPGSRPGLGNQNAIDLVDASGLYQRLPSSAPTDSAAYTFRSDKPSRVIDWILIPEGMAVDGYFVERSDLSDHRPVVADVRFVE